MKSRLTKIATATTFMLTLLCGNIFAAPYAMNDLTAEKAGGSVMVKGRYTSGNLTFLRPPTGREAAASDWCPDCGNKAAGRDMARVGSVYFRRMSYDKAALWCRSAGGRLATASEITQYLIPLVGRSGNGVWESELNWPQQNQPYWTADTTNEKNAQAFITKDYKTGDDLYTFQSRDRTMPFWPLCVTDEEPLSTAAPRPTREALNFVHIIVDDLRAKGLSMYGDSAIITPNLDKFSSDSAVFDRAYINIPTCGASRASMLSGLYGKRDRFVEYTARIDKEALGIVTLPEYLKDHGYLTLSYGKVIHSKGDSDHAWSDKPWTPSQPLYAKPEHRKAKSKKACKETGVCDPAKGGRAPAYEMEDVSDTAYHDGLVAEAAITALNTLVQAAADTPFYMAVGFYKPHLPFTAPKKYWDLYDRNAVQVSTTQFRPDNAPAGAWHNSGEIRNWYTGVPSVPSPWTQNVPSDETRSLTHGYYAAVSYTDAQIGKVLKTLDRLKLSKNTIVIVSSDHGFSLGDHTLWNKHSLFKIATKVPLMVRGPNIPRAKNIAGVVEYVDIYPTVVDLAGLEKPSHLHGKSFKRNLYDASLPTKPAVFPRYQRGDNITTQQYSYSAYFGGNGPKDHNRMTGHMLYDHANDPLETKNLVDNPTYRDTVLELQGQLVEHIKAHDPKRNNHRFSLLRPQIKDSDS